MGKTVFSLNQLYLIHWCRKSEMGCVIPQLIVKIIIKQEKQMKLQKNIDTFLFTSTTNFLVSTKR